MLWDILCLQRSTSLTRHLRGMRWNSQRCGFLYHGGHLSSKWGEQSYCKHNSYEQRSLQRRIRVIFRDFMLSVMQEPSFLKVAEFLRCKSTEKLKVLSVLWVIMLEGNITTLSIQSNHHNQWKIHSRYQKIYLSMKSWS